MKKDLTAIHKDIEWDYIVDSVYDRINSGEYDDVGLSEIIEEIIKEYYFEYNELKELDELTNYVLDSLNKNFLDKHDIKY